MKAKRYESYEDLEAAIFEVPAVPGYFLDTNEGHQQLWVILPTGLFSRLPLGGNGWQIQHNADETITITPSIWNRGSGDGDWHGFLTNDEFISV